MRFNRAQGEAIFVSLLSTASGASIALLINGKTRASIFASGLVLAVSLFFWRFRFRLFYALIEIAFGLFVLWDAAGKGRGDFSSAFSSDFLTFQLSVALLQTIAAIYVVICGLDNFFQGLGVERRQKIKARLKQWHM